MTDSYDSLVPKMTAVLSSNPSQKILKSVTFILERAMSDVNYTFPSLPSSSYRNESTTSLHGKGYSASITSNPSSQGPGAREQVLEDLGMKGLGEMKFLPVKVER